MIKHIRSRSIAVFIAVAALHVMSCNKKLDIAPQNSIPADQALLTADDVNAAVNGLYAKLDDPSLYGTDLNLDAELMGGYQQAAWTGTFTQPRQMYRKTLTDDNSRVANLWLEAYADINLANVVLSKLNLVTDSAQKANMEGQALFIRGILHFELVRFFALPWDPTGTNTKPGVVIQTKPTSTEAEAEAKSSRSTVAEVYKQIESDLKSAIAKLPERDASKRANRYTAMAFLARVYLQQSRFAEALPLADDIIQNGGFQLTPTVDGAFLNKNTSETLLEIQQNDQNNAGASNDGLSTFYADRNGIGRGGDVDIPQAFVDLMDPADARLTLLIYEGETDGQYHTGKWFDPGQNIPVIRLAELYLVRAECNERLGSAVGATPLEDVNVVHTRAGLPELIAVTLDDILLERRLELAFEGLRIHDIKRLKQSTNGGSDMTTVYPWNADKLVFPIPEREINANSSLVQNPGY
ncbi:RagB/SusD family nutrient uptake outer membrane protein [Chitinophaga polysaccharea]|uniref:RagB/SusD family nutrient uptake outer membrane protein n=1 Tax=Chitinophaga polysaccharea TaxID=1293035 RepID=UPI001157FB06|nr:RagB/SusD family nutrient uptake outer membrane protein [Chitinophaga polysaccharea]